MGGRYILSKAAQAIFTIAMLIVLNFVLFRMMPGSPERVLGRNPNVSAAALEATRERWGLDKPVLPDQFVSYLGAMSQGDLGFSFVYAYWFYSSNLSWWASLSRPVGTQSSP